MLEAISGKCTWISLWQAEWDLPRNIIIKYKLWVSTSMVHGIIFDCWNTLFYDDVSVHGFIEFAEVIDQSMDDYIYLKTFENVFMLKEITNINDNIKELLEKFDIKKEPALIKNLAAILEQTNTHVKPYPDVIEKLQNLRGKYQLILLSNTLSTGFRVLEEKYQLSQLFDLVVASYKLGLLKPDAKMFEYIEKTTELPASELLMVGDSLQDDIRAAREFGINAVLLDRRGKFPEFKDRIESLEELDEYL